MRDADDDLSTVASAPPREGERVRTFLSGVQARTARLERELQLALCRAAAAEQELAATREGCARATSDLKDLRERYEAELKERGERTGALVAQLLDERLAPIIEQMRDEVRAQYETRLRQSDSCLADKDGMLARLGAERETERRELAACKAAAAEEIESLRRKHAAERESLTTELEQRVAPLLATLAEKEELFTRANDLVASLQAEVGRVSAAAVAETKALREGRASDRQQLELQITSLEERLGREKAQVKELEGVVAHSEDLQRARALERDKAALAAQLEQRERDAQALASALTVLREICAKSQAVRSIIGGARNGIDLSQLFAVLDR